MKKIVVLLLLIVSLLAVSCDAESIMQAAKMMKKLKEYTLSDYGPKQVNAFSDMISNVFEDQDEDSIISHDDLGPVVDSIIELSESVVGSDNVRNILLQKWQDKNEEDQGLIDFLNLSLDIVNSPDPEDSDYDADELKEKVTTLVEKVLGLPIDDFVKIANPDYESKAEDIKDAIMDLACQQVRIMLKAVNGSTSVINSFQSMFQDYADREYKSFGDHVAASIMGDIITEVTTVFMETVSSGSNPNYLDTLVKGDSGDRILKDIRALQYIYGTKVGLDKLVGEMVNKKK